MVAALIVLLSCADLGLAAAVALLGYQRAIYLQGDRVTGKAHLPAGYTLSGQFVDLGARGEDCVVIRCTSVRRPFCSADEARWRSLESAFIKRGCAVFSIAPSVADAAKPGDPAELGTAELVYLDPIWIGRLQPRAEPTVLIFGADRRLLWRATGQTDSARATRALSVLGARPRAH